MSTNDDPRGFRRGHPASREYSQKQRGQSQQSRDRYDQFPQQSDPYASQLPPERPQASFSAYKPEAYAQNKAASQSPADNEWNRRQQRPAPRQPRADMGLPQPPRDLPPPPPRQEPPAHDPFSVPSDLSNDPFYQPASSDPYASHSGGDFDHGGNWDDSDFGDAPNQFQNFYPQDNNPGFNGDPQSVHDEFFAGMDHGMDEVPPPPLPGNGRDMPAFDDDFDANAFADFDQAPDDPFARHQPHPFDDADDGFGAEPPQQRGRGPQPGEHQARGGPQGFDDQDFYDWGEFEQAPAPPAARPFHPPAVRDEDLDADFFADEDDFDIDEYEGGGGKNKLLAAVLAGAVVVGGGGAYLYNSGNSDFSAGNTPSLITADNSPIKAEPEEPGGRDFPNGNKLIYDRLGDNGPVSQQQASASSSSGNNPDQVAAVPGLVTSTGDRNGRAVGGNGTLEERIENALRAQGGNGQNPQPRSTDTPRTVQTLTFGPDGSQQPTQQQVQTVTVDTNNGGGGANPVSSSVVVSTQPSSSPSYESVQASPATSSVTAQPAPQYQQQQPQQQARLVTANPQAGVVSVTGGGSDAYFVQIGARNDPQAATDAFKILQQRYASVIGNYSPSLRKADLGSKGVWYRLWVGPVADKAGAEALCDQLKQAGMKACLVRKDQ